MPYPKTPPLTPDLLRSFLHYDPDSGVFTWLVGKRGGVNPGDVAGCKQRRDKDSSALLIRLGGRLYLAHRLVWLYVHGRCPRHYLDHINGDPGDNRLDNLREATPCQNSHNMRRHRDNRTGYKGVCRGSAASRNDHRWVAAICVRGRRFHLGYFDTPEEAAHAYNVAALERHGEFARSA